MLDTTDNPFPMVSQRRRIKASLVMLVVWVITIVLHVVPVTRWAVTGLAAGMVVYAGRLVAEAPISPPPVLEGGVSDTWRSGAVPEIGREEPRTWPKVSLLVPAKNEETVIPQLLACLQKLDYPSDRWEVWAIDDASTDDTAGQLRLWQERLPQ